MIKQLNPPLPLLTPKGPGLAHFLIDYGPEHHLHWVVALDGPGITGDVGECWEFQNHQIRFCNNFTMGRSYSKTDGGTSAGG
jgi:hypothetical protein